MNMIAEQPGKEWRPAQKADLFLEVRRAKIANLGTFRIPPFNQLPKNFL